MRFFSNRCYRSPISFCAAVLLIALAWSGGVGWREMQDAAKLGDLDRVKAILKDDPNWAFSKGSGDITPLHAAVANHNDEMADLLRQYGAKE
jgi:ankyrin repeat protein